MITDLQNDILEMQEDVSAIDSVTSSEESKLSPLSTENSNSCAMPSDANKVDLVPVDLFDALKADDNKFELNKMADSMHSVDRVPVVAAASATNSDDVDIKSEIKDDPDLIPAFQIDDTNNKKFPAALAATTKETLSDVDDPYALSPALADSSDEMKQKFPKMLTNHVNTKDQHSNEYYDVKKELEQLDIESEITPSYIKKADHHSVHNNVNHRPPTPPELNLDYLCSPDSVVPIDDERKNDDDLINPEPYDEWICIQKELNLITDKPDGYASSSSNSNMGQKMSVENQLDDLFNNHRPDDDTNDKSDIGNMVHGAQSPLSELFNDTIASIDKTLENRLENMFADANDFEKTNDLVETRLEELFHGSTSPTALSGQISQEEAYHQINSQMHNNVDLLLQNTDEHGQQIMGHVASKRQWTQNVSSCMQPSNKRSCMVSSYMEAANASAVDHNWIMDCQQESFDFMANDNGTDHQIGHNHHDASKDLWNGHDVSSNGGSNAADGLLLNQKYNNSIKSHDLERDLLGLSTSSSPISMDNSAAAAVLLNQQQQQQSHHQTLDLPDLSHNDNSYDASNASVTNSNSFVDDDINRHVQNAIDSILNLQNSEADSLHYQLDQSMASFMADNPLTVPSNDSYRTQHTHSMEHNNHYLPRRSTNRFADTGDCLISGDRSLDDDHVGLLMDSPPIMQQSNDMQGMGTNASGVDDTVKSIITS